MTLSRGTAAALLAALFCFGCGGPPAPQPEPDQPRPAPPAAAVVPAPESPAQASNEHYSTTRTARIPVDREKVGQKRVELWVTADGGKSWANRGEIDSTAETVPFLSPRDGRFGYVLVPLSATGQREFTPRAGDAPPRRLVIDTDPPVVELLSPNGGEVFGAGRSTVVQWVAEDPNMAPAGIRIEASTGDGEVWVPIAKDLPNTGQYHWDIGRGASSRFRLRIVARDLAGNVGIDASDRAFTVDGMAPDLRPVGPATANALPVAIRWAGADAGGAGLKRVTLYVTKDFGQTWRAYGDDPDLRSPFVFKDLDGIYGLRLVAEDRMGNANPEPAPGTPPQMTLTLDRTKPAVKLLSPKSGGYHASVPVDVKWTASDNLKMPDNSVGLFYSDDNGKTWKEIVQGVKNDGLYQWKAPASRTADYRFKVAARDAAGNVGEAVSDLFGVDEAVPQARAVSPDGSRSNSVQIHYEIRKMGRAPVKRVTLYYKPKNVREWVKGEDDPDNRSPILFAKADGEYGIFITCATESGLKSEYVQKPPTPTTGAQLILRIDATPPQVQLETFAGGGFAMSGSVRDIVWKMVEPNPNARGLNVYHSADGGATWTVVVTNADPTVGRYRWTVPRAPGARNKIRLVVEDRYGNKSVAVSERPFTIDSELPTVQLRQRAPAFIRTGRLSLPYVAKDLTSGIDRVRLYARRMGVKDTFRALAQSEVARGTLEVDLPSEGLWGFVLSAVDSAGHEAVDIGRVKKPDFTVGFDATPPTIELKGSQLSNGKRTHVNQKWEVEWTAKDTFTDDKALRIRIEYSSDGGKTWLPAYPAHENVGRADMRPYFSQGKRYRVRVIAADEAGNQAEDSSEDFDPGDVPPPPLALLGITDGGQYVAGEKATLHWRSEGGSLLTVDLQMSSDGGKTWPVTVRMHSRRTAFEMPKAAGRYYLRAVGRDESGRPSTSNYISFSTISGVERVRIVTHGKVEPAARCKALIGPGSIVKTARKLELQISSGKGEWRKITDVTNAYVSYVAPTAPGEYYLRVFVEAEDGKRYTSNEAKLVVRAGPAGGLALQNFTGGRAYAGGVSLPVMVRTGLDPAALKVEFSEKAGKDGTWMPAAVQAAEGRIFWKLPSVTSAECRLRVTGPGGTRTESAGTFTIDSRKPAARATGPTAETTAPALVEADVQASVTPVETVKLYVTENGGRTWTLHRSTRDPKKILLDPGRPGDYGVYLVARSSVGLEGEAPTPGRTAPQVVIRVRGRSAAPPQVVKGPDELVTKLPARIKGGNKQALEWKFADAAQKVSVHLVVDGNRSDIAVGQDAAKSIVWNVPQLNSRRCRIVLKQGDREVRSEVFEIDSSAPGIESVEVELPNR